jgi:hypothetical protein
LEHSALAFFRKLVLSLGVRSLIRGISPKLRMLNGPETREYVKFMKNGLHVAFQCFKRSVLERNGGIFGKLELKNVRAWHVGRLSLF